MLKENGYQQSIITKTFKGIANKHSIFPSQQQIQATDIQVEETRKSMKLPYVQGTSERLSRILRSQKIRSNFYTESTLHNLLCKHKDRVATHDRNNIVYVIDSDNCKAVCFIE